MVGKGTGTEQSHPKHLNYRTAGTECNKTVAKSCNKYTNTEAMVTMKFIGEHETASHVERGTNSGQQECSPG